MTSAGVAWQSDIPIAPSDCPYRGLRSYTESDSAFFFGRDSDTDLVVASVLASRVSVLCGLSGVGKSSLLQAGVLHSFRHVADGAFSFLAADEVVAVYFSAWRDDPLRELGRAVYEALPRGPIRDELLAQPRPLSVEMLSDVVARFDADVYLLLDQMEELALYHAGESGDTIGAEIGRIVNTPNLRVSILLGVREDALARLDQLERHIPGMLANYLRLDHLSAEGARQAIEGPLGQFNRTRPVDQAIEIEADLVDGLLTDLRTGEVAVTETGGGGLRSRAATIETPFLQLVMTRLWAQDIEPGRARVMRLSTLESLGGAQNIVRTHLDDVMNQLTDAQRSVAAQVFRYLVTPSGSKIAHSSDDLAYFSGAADLVSLNQLLEELSSGDHRVLRPVPPPVDHPGPTRYEIFHDVMAPAILDWRRRYVQGEERAAAERELVRAKEDAEADTRVARTKLRRSRILFTTLIALVVVVAVFAVIVFQALQSSARSDALRRQASTSAAQQSIAVDPAASLHTLRTELDEGNSGPSLESALRQALDADLNRLTLQTDSTSANAAAYSPDGTTILTAGDDGRVALYDSKTGAPGLTLQRSPATGPILSASFSKDGSMIAAVTAEGVVTVWDAATGNEFPLLQFGGRGTTADASTASWGVRGGHQVLLVTGRNGEPPELWDPKNNRRIATFGDSQSGSYWGASLRADGERVVAVAFRKSESKYRVVLWDVGSGTQTAVSPDALYYATEPRFISIDSDAVVFVSKPSGGNYQPVRWDGTDHSDSTIKAAAYSRLEMPTPLALSPDGTRMAFVADKWVFVYDTKDMTQIGQIPQQTDLIYRIAFSPDGSSLATGLGDGTVTVWDATSWNNRPIHRLLGHRNRILDLQYALGSASSLVTAAADGTTRTWQLPEDSVLQDGMNGWVQDADVDPHTGRVVIARQDGNATSFDADLRRGPTEDLVPAKGALLFRIDLSPQGNLIAGRMDNSYALRLYDLEAQRFIPLDSSENILYTGPAFNDDGSRVAAADWKNNLIVWDTKTGKISRGPIAAGAPSGWTSQVAFVPGTDELAAAGSDGQVRIWDSTSDQPKRTLSSGSTSGSAADLTAMDFSEDGRKLVTVSGDHVVRLYDLSTDGDPQNLDGPPATIDDVDFSDDGKLIAGAAADGNVYIWSADTLMLTGVLSHHGDLVNSVKFLPDGKRLLTASDDGTALVFDCGLACQPFDEVANAARDRDSHRSPSG